MEIDFLKYVAWAIPLAISFTGAWIFQFTTTDKDTNRKHLTNFGKIAFVAASVALILSVYLFIDSDRRAQAANEVATDKAKRQQEVAEYERQKAEAERALAEDFRMESAEQLGQIQLFISSLIGDGQVSQNQIEDVLRVFPDLREAFEKASSVDQVQTLQDFWALADQQIAKQAMEKFDWRFYACGEIFRVFKDARGWVLDQALIAGDEIAFTSYTDSSSAYFTALYRDADSRNVDFSVANLSFTSESGKSFEIECDIELNSHSCRASFSDSPPNRLLHKALREQKISEFLVTYDNGSSKSFKIPVEVARKLKLIGECTIP